MTSTTYGQPIVVDNGSDTFRAGFAGSDIPQVSINSCIGRPRHEKVLLTPPLSSSLQDETTVDELQWESERDSWFIGDKCKKHRGVLSLTYPFSSEEYPAGDGVDDMVKIWDTMYQQDYLSVSSDERFQFDQKQSQQHPVMITGFPTIPLTSSAKKSRKAVAEVFFEQFQAPALYFIKPTTLSLYAHGKVTGCVIDSGKDCTVSVPIYQGYEIKNAVRRIEVAGKHVTRQLNRILRQQGYIFHTTSEMEVVKEIKRNMCSINPFSEAHATKDAKTQNVEESYVLPDGREIVLEQSLLNEATEMLFDPGLAGMEYEGVPAALLTSVFTADISLRQPFLSNVLLTGGSTLFRNYRARMEGELKAQLTMDKFKVKDEQMEQLKLSVTSSEELLSGDQCATNVAWLGGSVLASMASFQNLWISRDAYYEQGSDCLY